MQERKRTAMLLSQLPGDIDISQLLQAEVVAAVSASPPKGKKSTSVAPNTAIKAARAG